MENAESAVKEAVCKGLVNHALDQVRMKYGDGNSFSETEKQYHNEKHTKSVIEEALALGEIAVSNEKILKSDLILIEIATAFHDVEQGKTISGENELESAKQARQMMEESKLFSSDEIQKVEDMIMATRVSFEVDGMKQSFVESKNYLTLIIADADVANLGQSSEIFWKSTNALMRELLKTDEPTIEQQVKFLQNSVKLLESHEYFTVEARNTYTLQAKNLESVKAKLAELTTPVLA